MTSAGDGRGHVGRGDPVLPTRKALFTPAGKVLKQPRAVSRPVSLRANKLKGANAEREVVQFLRDHLGDHIVRTRAGATEDRGDIAGMPEMVVQVKNYPKDIARAVREGVLGVIGQRESAGTLWGCVFVRRPGGGFYVVMTPEDFVSIYREAVLGRRT